MADALVRVLNVPGTLIVVLAAVGISLYLATTFTFDTAQEWATERFGFLGAMRTRWNRWRAKRRGEEMDAEVEVIDERGAVYGAKREKLAAEAEKARVRAEKAAAKAEREPNTLLDGLFGWWARRRGMLSVVPELSVPEKPAGSVWEAMPRMHVDAPPVTPLSTATAAVAPYADALAAAAAPLPLQPDEMDDAPAAMEPELSHRGATARARRQEDEDEPFSFLTHKPEAALAPVAEMPRRAVKAKAEAALPVSAYAAPAEAPAAGPISFGRRADTDQKPVAITAKSVRGYKLPSSSLLYRSEEQAVVREEALRDEAQVLVQKCGEFGVDGQVTQINPGPVVTTFEFRRMRG